MSFLNPFARRPRDVSVDCARAKAMVREALGLDAETTVTVTEITCPDRGCSDPECLILIHTAGAPTTSLRLRRSLAALTPADILAGAGAAMHDCPAPTPSPRPLAR